jgi:2'-5' RNA ligase
MIRAFVALPLPHEVERRLATIIADLSKRSREVKWVRAESVHLTVKFLGDTDEKLIYRIGAALDAIAAESQPMVSVIDRLGGFPSLKRPRVIWAGGGEPLDPAVRLAGRGDAVTAEFGFDRETRPFKAHLTLGRVREGRRVDDLARYIESYRVEPCEMRLDRLVLIKSILTPQGAIYQRLHEALLGGGARFAG